MSRIGKMPITLVDGVTATVDGNTITVKGPKGSLNFTFKNTMKVAINGTEIVIERPSDSKEDKSIHGTTRALINNMVIGVSQGYTIQQEVVGVGYKADAKGQILELHLGYSHPLNSMIYIVLSNLKDAKDFMILILRDKFLFARTAYRANKIIGKIFK